MNGSALQPLGRRQWNGEPLVLFVEGHSDLTFYAEFLEHLGKHQRCFIQDLGGKGRTNLEREALLLLKPDNLVTMASVGVILDADQNAASAFELAQRGLRTAVGVEISQPNIWVGSPAGKTKFGVFIVGDASSGKGEVETLVWSSWAGAADNRRLRDCISSYLDCATAAGRQLHSIDKARLGSLLAVLHDEDPRLGPAARGRVFDFTAAELDELRRFLGEM